jgi:MFS family permease/predicted Ser/Thr protein kinase
MNTSYTWFGLMLVAVFVTVVVIGGGVALAVVLATRSRPREAPRADRPVPRHEPAGPGFTLLAGMWALGLTASGLILGLSDPQGAFIFAPIFILFFLVVLTVVRSVWLNRLRLMAAVRYAHDAPPLPPRDDRPAVAPPLTRPAPRSGGRSKVVPVVLGTLALLAVFGVLTVVGMLFFGFGAIDPLLVILGFVVLGVLSLPAAGLVFWLMSDGRKDAPAKARPVEPARDTSDRRKPPPSGTDGLTLRHLGVLGLGTLFFFGLLPIVEAIGPGTPDAWAVLPVLGLAAVLFTVWLRKATAPAKPEPTASDVEATRAVPPVPSPLPSAAPAPPPLPRSCPKCGAAIAAGAPEGLCPRCLLGGLLPDDPKHSPTTAYGPFVPPTVEEVAPFFPQLEVIRLIGQGGMGAVYLARQKALDRLVALKLINVREDDPTFAERFAREAKAMGKLSHPNIVTIYDHGTADGLPYLVMEYVDGVTLRDVMRAKVLTPAEALKVIPQVCDALEYAHAQGVVHRDVKPENILLDNSGKVKIADFGLAKLVDPDGLSLTHTRQAMGTPHYMAPEQWERPTEVDHRADIYALGVLLYELLTGELPLGRFDPPSVKARVDARLDELILRALAKEPDRRFQHASDVKLALERLGTPGGWATAPGFWEYRSKAEFWGWPLVHVVGGRDPRTGRGKMAKGWIAIGGGGAVGGVAIGGGWAAGGVAIAGGWSFGLLALAGGGAVGVLALAGGLALAALAAGAGGVAAAGMVAGAGGFAAARFAASGGRATGEYVIDSRRQDADFWDTLAEFGEKLLKSGFTDW